MKTIMPTPTSKLKISKWMRPLYNHRLRHILIATIAFALLGLCVNVYVAMQGDDSLSTRSRQVSESYQQGLPDELTYKLVADGSNGPLSLELQAKNGFSACLIVKDDNHWLIEWIAYHYHVLPLRHLILVSDPKAFTSPTKILDRWRDKMIIEEWKDNDFLPDWMTRKAKQTNASDLWLHLNRQTVFYAKCLQNLHERQRGWVTLTDSDEFIRINPYLHAGVKAHFRSQGGHVGQFLQMLRQEKGVDASCLLLPRIQVSTVEAKQQQQRSSLFTFGQEKISIPEGFNATDFLTLRYLYHNNQEMDAGKNIVDLRRLDFRDLPLKRAESVHHVLTTCPNNTAGALQAPGSHLQIHHYLGSFEQFTYRHDPRDDIHDRWTSWYSRGRNPEPNTRDLHTAGWLSGFVQKMGREQASVLLKDVGKLEPRPDGMDQPRRKKPVLDAPPPPEVFSACLVLKDDNHFLVEWLAFHYHVLPLRDLIVIVDPTSVSSPKHIFQRWEGKMNITVWEDASVIPKHIFKKVEKGNITASGLHRQRQQFFYGKCLRELKQRHASWTLLADTDEFVVPNPDLQASHRVMHSLKKPAAVRKILQLRIKSRKTKDHTYAPACFLLPRLQITSQLPEKPDVMQKGVPSGFNGDDFLTTKWLFHNGQEIFTGHNLDGKNIINLDNLKFDQIPNKVQNVHYAIPEICPKSDGERLNHEDTWLWIYHYLGTLEQYTFRSDPRDQIPGRLKRNETLWRTAGRNGQEATLREDTVAIREWIHGFIESVGWMEAQRLLKGAGKVEGVATWGRLFQTK